MSLKRRSKKQKALLNILVAARLAAAFVQQAGGTKAEQRRAYKRVYGTEYARYRYQTSPQWRAAAAVSKQKQLMKENAA